MMNKLENLVRIGKLDSGKGKSDKITWTVWLHGIIKASALIWYMTLATVLDGETWNRLHLSARHIMLMMTSIQF